jgi:hypothetical protein
MILLKYKWTLIISKVVYCLRSIYSPLGPISPHSFNSQCLTSGFSLEITRKNIHFTKKAMLATREEVFALRRDIEALKQARTLHNANIDPEQNNILKDFKNNYSSFFDEDNTDREGLDQLHEYLTGELKTNERKFKRYTDSMNNWHKEMKEFFEERKKFPDSSSSNPDVKNGTTPNMDSSSSNSDVKNGTTPNMDTKNFLPLIPMVFNNSYIISIYRSIVYLFKLLLPLIGIIVSLDLIPITIPTFLGLFSEFFFNRLLFLWSSFRIIRNIIFYIKIFGYVKSLVNTTDYPDFLLLVLITVFSLVLPFYLEISFSTDILLCS